ncbi:MAG TPA: hypothetical protein VFS13_00640 [Steroidobacteraceae bacterium]|nr:hypothetical protein [Steroidobacteraceae bacterium]
MAITKNYRFRLRRRAASSWASLNEVLLDSEFGLESDTGKLKIGNGTDGFNDRPYIDEAIELGRLRDVDATDQAGAYGLIWDSGYGTHRYVPLVQSCSSGTGITVDNTDPANPVINNDHTTIDSLDDVDTTGRSDGDVLTWDAGSSTHVYTAPSGGGGGSYDHLIAYRSGALTVGAATAKVALNAVSLDDNSIWDSTNNRAIPKKAGYYLVTMRVRCTSAGGMVGYVYKNGGLYSAVGGDFGAGGFAVGGAALVYCNGSTDYIEIGIYSSNSRSLDTSSVQTNMMIVGPY